jgi:toxin ParE1/3/4
LAQVIRYIARENPSAARRIKRLLEAAILPAAEHPYLYRNSERIPSLREIVAHPNYLVLYRIMSTCIEVVNVVHARREFPN